MDKVNSEDAVRVVSNVLQDFGFENYIVAIPNKDLDTEEFDAVISGSPDTVAKLLLALIARVPDKVKKRMSNHLIDAFESKQRGDD